MPLPIHPVHSTLKRVSLSSAGLPAEGARDRFVEDLGLFFEQSGAPRSAGRLLGWLIVCDPPEQSAEDLARALRASSGGISTNTRMLMRGGYVERVGVPGDRRAFYRVRPNAWNAIFDERQASLVRLREIAENGAAALAGQPDSQRRRVVEMVEFARFLESAFPALVRRYHEEAGDGE